MTDLFSHGYALLVGVGESAYPKWSLPVTVRDMEALRDVLTDPGLCGYPSDAGHVRLLYDAGATRQAILDGLVWLAQQSATDEDATVIVFYSGHGWLDEATGRYYLLPHDVEPFNLTASALPAEMFTAALRQVHARRLLVFVDSCHAGGMASAKDAATVKLPDGFSQAALPKSLAEELKQGAGRAVFSSSTDAQKSWVRPDDAMSLYTFHLIEALQGAGNRPGDTEVRVSNLMNHLGKAVPESALTLCQAEQTPFFDAATEDFPVAKLRGGKGLPKGGWAEIQEGTRDRAKVVQRGKYNVYMERATGVAIGDGARASIRPATPLRSEGTYPGGEAMSPLDSGAGPSTVETKYHVEIHEGRGVVVGDGAQVTQYIQAAPELDIPLPPESERPPETVEFIGRESELAGYAERLRTSHLAVIIGEPGVGKTWLAARLARQAAGSAQLFWYAFHEGSTGGAGIEALIWKVAAFLAVQGQDGLWRKLQSARLTGSQPEPPEVLFDYLVQLLRGRGYLLCLDDFQYVDQDSLVNKLVQRLAAIVAAGEISLIFTSRRIPAFARSTDPLAGLTLGDAAHLLTTRGLSLPTDLVADLHRRTAGNPQLLTLVVNALVGHADPAQLITRLAEERDIARYLMAEVHKRLTEEEQAVMAAVAVLMSYPGTRDAIEAILDADAWEALTSLSERYLLTTAEGSNGREYGQHAIVRDFYYRKLGAAKRELHMRAAIYYAREKQNPPLAAIHYEQAGALEEATACAARDVWETINRGLGAMLGRLRVALSEGRSPNASYATALWAHGEFLAYSGNPQDAEKSFRAALAALTGLAATPERKILEARACLGIAKRYQRGEPAKARSWLDRGLAALAGTAPEVEAALRVIQGSVLIMIGELDKAEETLKRSLKLLSAKTSSGRIEAFLNLGAIEGQRGHIRKSQEYTEQALKLAEDAGDYFRMIPLLNNRANDRFEMGDWPSALADAQKARELAERTGNRSRLAGLELNLGFFYLRMGEHAAAAEHLAVSRELAEAQYQHEYAIPAQTSQAELSIRQGDLTTAAALLAEAINLATASGAQSKLPDIYRAFALLKLAQGQPKAAAKEARLSIAFAQKQKMIPEEGSSRRVLGQALAAMGQHAAAWTEFNRSRDLLADTDVYEAARTIAAWGCALLSAGDQAHGATLLAKARATFERLGARWDLCDLTV